MRIGDGEREGAERELRRQFAAGRLEADELEERLALVAAARDRADLGRALRDLPGALRRVLTAPARTRGAEVARRVDRAAIRTHTVAFAGLNGGAVTVWAAAGAGVFWPAAVLVPTTLLLGGHVRARRAVRRRLPSGRP